MTYLSLGSNLGNRLENLIKALEYLKESGNKITRISSFYQTKPWGKKSQPDFLNMVVELETSFSPFSFLALIQRIEKEMGRVKREKWGPRTIDIDIVLFDDLEMESEKLTIPHPRARERAFVLVPLAEILPVLPEGFELPDNKANLEQGVSLYSVDDSIIGRIENLLKRD